MKEKEILLEKNDMTLKLEKFTKSIDKHQVSRSKLSKKKSLQEKGITLIALVVTIIILLILAGVTLNMALSQNGLFSKTQEAADKYKKAQEDEELEIEKIEYAVDGKDIKEVKEISTLNDFKEFRESVNKGEDYENTLIKLTDDLDLSEENTWTPIGTKENPFNGVFNGNGHEIKDLVLGQVENGKYALSSDGGSWIGLFGYNEGIIKNVGIKSVSINADEVDGYGIGILAGCNEGKIEMCYNKAGVTCESSLDTFGGIVGYLTGNRYC